VTLRFIDCQGFAGGGTLGVSQAGFELVAKKEMQPGFGMKNCLANTGLLGDQWVVNAQSAAWEEWEPHEAEVLYGNPPCSGFSLLSRSDFRGEESRVNACMWAFAGYAAKVRPQVAIFESVQQAYRQGVSLMQRLRDHVEERTGLRYDLYHVLHNNASLGGAAVRKRYFFVISQVPFGVEIPAIERVPTLEESIGDLRGLANQWEPQRYVHDATWWSADRRDPSGSVDGMFSRESPLARRAFDLMKNVDWREGDIMSQVARRHYQDLGHLPESWEKTAAKLVGNDFSMGFYQVMRWDRNRPARVITGGGPDLVIHYEEQRLLTHRECARIQGFPDDWKIEPLRTVTGLGATWGKGIPVDCGRWIGTWAKNSIEGNPGSDMGEQTGDREFLINCTDAYKKVRPAGAKW
jgi:site-specific DNA-cytosine methylase